MSTHTRDANLDDADLRAALRRIGDAIPVSAMQPRAVSLAAAPVECTRLGRRQFLAAATGLAAAAVVAGLFAVADHPTRQPIGPLSPPLVSWSVVPDPAGVFVPPEGLIEDTGNSISVNDVGATAYGLIAVGSESFDYGSVGAIWTSSDGTSWTRVPEDPKVFGSRERSGAPRTGFSIDHVTESDGTIVAMGTAYSNPLGSMNGRASVSNPAVWQSSDGATWTRIDLSVDEHSTVEIAAIAARKGVLLAVGWERVGAGTEGPALPRIWRSTNGTNWTVTAFLGSQSADVELTTLIAVDDGFITAGRANGHAAAWSSTDGTAWTLTDLSDGGVAADETTVVRSAAVSNGILVAVGAVQSSGQDGTVGWGSIDNKTLQVYGRSNLAIWTSTDGTSWQRAVLPDPVGDRFQVAGPIAGGPDGFVMITRVISEQPSLHALQVTMTSADGTTWTTTEAAAPGARVAIAATDTGWVTVGSATDFRIELPGSQDVTRSAGADGASVWIGRD